VQSKKVNYNFESGTTNWGRSINLGLK